MEKSVFFKPENFEAVPGVHRGKSVLWIKCRDEKEDLKVLQTFFSPKYSKTCKSWYVADMKNLRTAFRVAAKTIGASALSEISEVNLPEFRKFQELMILQGLSVNTQRTYCNEFAQLLHLIRKFPVKDLSEEKIRSYILYCHVTLQLSENQIHSRMNALKYYFEKVLGREKLFLSIPRPKKHLKLPKTLNPSEITKMILVTENLKHRLILKFGYGLGLRVSEIVNLKIEHIDSVEMTVMIERAKGKKDRYVNLPETVLDDLRIYLTEFKPDKFLFEGSDGGAFSQRSAQSVFKTAMKKAGIQKSVGIHALRHSYATHLLQYGTDISLIQKLLGHNNIKTTLIYTEVTDRDVSKVGSPLDRLQEMCAADSYTAGLFSQSDCSATDEFVYKDTYFDLPVISNSSEILHLDGKLFKVSLYAS